MKVKELIKQLQALKNDNLEVYSAIDDEGNGYNKLYYSPTIYYREKSATNSQLDSDSVRGADDMEDEDEKDFVKIVII